MVPPPPSQALKASIEKMGRVRLRVPVRALVLAALGACAYPAWTLIASPLRQDLGALPIAWTTVVAALWLVGFGLPMAFAVLPPSDQVLPDGPRAFRIAGLMAVLSIGASLLLGAALHGGSPIAPGSPAALTSWRACMGVGLEVTLLTIAISTLAIRRVVLPESWRWGAAVGAAGGMLAGLTLHLTCSNSSPAHLGVAHGGGVVIGAVLGALTRFALDRNGR